MKDTGKTIHGVKVYTDPEIPPNQLFLLNGNFVDKNPRRLGKLEGIYEPPKSYGFWRRLKWHLWGNL